MGLVKMPAVNAYWENELRFSPIADSLSCNRFFKLQRNLHFADNNLATDELKTDRIWKLRPWITSLQKNFRAVSSDEFQCVDEIMIAFKGRSLVKQYLPKKPKKWGFKLWGRCTSSGFLHDFEVYQGKGTGLEGNQVPECGLGGNVVLQLSESLPRNQHYKIFADNYFTNFSLAAEIKRRGIGEFTGTIQQNRCHGAPLKTEKDLKAEGRGSYHSVYERNDNLALVR